jgi:O-methyltransferase involved in polyketide biosynthesis
LNYDWIPLIQQHEKGPFLFVAEGVFMYLHKEDVKSLVLTLQSQFPGSELVCEVVNKLWLSKFLKPLMYAKMQKRLGLGKDAIFHFGISKYVLARLLTGEALNVNAASGIQPKS